MEKITQEVVISIPRPPTPRMNDVTTTEYEPSVRETLDTIRRILNIDPALTGIDYLAELVKNAASQLGVDYAFVGHTKDDDPEVIHTDVVWGKGKILDNFNYELEATPCQVVTSGDRVCIYDHSVSIKFPQDDMLRQMNIESYVGIPTIAPGGEHLGILVLLDQQPLQHR